MTIIVFIIVFAGVMYLLSLLFPKVFGEGPFWKRFFVLVSKRVVNYYCTTTPAKVVIWILRLNSVGYGLTTIGYPAVEAIVTKQSFWLSLKWSETDGKLTALYLSLNILLGISYFITQRYGGSATKEDHKRQEEQHKKLFEQQTAIIEAVDKTHSKLTTLNDVVSNLPFHYHSIFIRNIRDTQKDIEDLKFTAALNHLKGIRELVEEYCPNAKNILSKIEYWEACCLKYLDTSKSISKYKNAYALLDGVDRPKEVIEGYIFALCYEVELEEAQQIADTYYKNKPNDVWKYIPAFLKSDDKDHFFSIRHIANKNFIEDILAESVLLIQKLDQSVILKQYPISPQKELELSYSTFPKWVLYLSYALSDFVSDLYLPFNGDNIATHKSELLYSLTTIFIEKDNYQELKGILPDIRLYHAFTGFLHDGQQAWIDIIKKQLNSCHDVDLAHLFLSYALYRSNEKEEAINVLKDYSTKNHDLDWTLISMLSSEGKWDEIEEHLTIMVETGNTHVPPMGYSIILNLVRFFPERYSTLAKKFSFDDEVNDEIFKNFISFFEGDKTVIDSLLKQESSASNVFNSIYPTVYEVNGDLETAIVKAKCLLPQDGVNINSIRYAELLEKASNEKDLLRYLQNIRKRGVLHIPFLFKELYLETKIHNHIATVEICNELLKLCPEDYMVIYNSIMCYYQAGKTLEGRNILVDKLKEAPLDTIMIENVFNVLINDCEYEIALDYLYDCIQNTHDQTLRDFFYQVHLDDELGKLIDKEKEFVEEGDYIEYSDGASSFSTNVRANGMLAAFIGKKVGATIELNQGVRVQVFTLLKIQTKYAGLLSDVVKDIYNHRSSTIRCFNFDDIKDNPLEGLKKFIEAYRGSDSESYEEQLKLQNERYQNGKIPIALAKGHPNLNNLYELIFGEFRIIQKPLLELKSKFTGIDIRSSFSNIVLDLSSLILIHAISKKFGIIFKDKFIISQRTFDYIKENSLASKRSPRDILYGATLRVNLNQFILSDDDPVLLSVILDDLLQWIKSNCNVMVVDDMVGFKQEDIPTMMEAHLENILLSQKPNSILITEDVWLYKYYLNPIVVNTEFFFMEMMQTTLPISKYLTGLNYLGHNISGDFIIEQILLKEHQSENGFEYCLEILKHNPYVLSSLISVSYKLEKGIISTLRFKLIDQVFYTIFEALGYERSSHVFGQLQIFPISKLVRESLERAFNRIESKQLIKRPSGNNIIV